MGKNGYLVLLRILDSSICHAERLFVVNLPKAHLKGNILKLH